MLCDTSLKGTRLVRERAAERDDKGGIQRVWREEQLVTCDAVFCGSCGEHFKTTLVDADGNWETIDTCRYCVSLRQQRVHAREVEPAEHRRRTLQHAGAFLDRAGRRMTIHIVPSE